MSTTTTTGGPARRRTRRGPRLAWLGLLPVTGALLATVAAAPASAGQLSHPTAPARHAGHHQAAASAPMTLAQAPAGLRAADGQADFFGVSIAVSGNTAVVGADLVNNFAGAAYEFVRTGTTWTEKAKFTGAGGTPNDRLGFGVAIAGTTALVGAPGHNNFHGQVDLFPL